MRGMPKRSGIDGQTISSSGSRPRCPQSLKAAPAWRRPQNRQAPFRLRSMEGAASDLPWNNTPAAPRLRKQTRERRETGEASDRLDISGEDW